MSNVLSIDDITIIRSFQKTADQVRIKLKGLLIYFLVPGTNAIELERHLENLSKMPKNWNVSLEAEVLIEHLLGIGKITSIKIDRAYQSTELQISGDPDRIARQISELSTYTLPQHVWGSK